MCVDFKCRTYLLLGGTRTWSNPELFKGKSKWTKTIDQRFSWDCEFSQWTASSVSQQAHNGIEIQQQETGQGHAPYGVNGPYLNVVDKQVPVEFCWLLSQSPREGVGASSSRHKANSRGWMRWQCYIVSTWKYASMMLTRASRSGRSVGGHRAITVHQRKKIPIRQPRLWAHHPTSKNSETKLHIFVISVASIHYTNHWTYF